MDKTISVRQLQEKLTKHEHVFILDVRPTDQRNEWKIAGSVHVDAYQKLNAFDDTALDIVEVPADATVVTVCAAGRTSLLASQLLQRKGVDAYSLEGGMKAWNYAWNTAEMEFSNSKVVQVRRTAKGVLSYIVGSAAEAVVIDAALDPAVYQAIAKDNGWVIKYVIDTHIHADYVSRSRALENASGARHALLENTNVDFDFVAVKNRGTVCFGNTYLEFIHTPGHTWDSTSFKLGDEAIFTGDTLFIDGIGRPDLKADQNESIERARALYSSLRNLFSMNSEIVVFPAHTSGAVGFDNKLIADTIMNIATRVRVGDWSESDFIEYATSRIPPTPANYQKIASINRGGSYDRELLADLEAGGNHCAIT